MQGNILYCPPLISGRQGVDCPLQPRRRLVLRGRMRRVARVVVLALRVSGGEIVKILPKIGACGFAFSGAFKYALMHAIYIQEPISFEQQSHVSS